MIYSLLGFYSNWLAYNVFAEGHPRRWEVILMSFLCCKKIKGVFFFNLTTVVGLVGFEQESSFPLKLLSW